MINKILSLSCCLVLALSLGACNKKPDTIDPSAEKTPSKETTGSTDELKRYGVQSGTVEYVLTGTQSGKKTISWDDWGMKEATISETTITAGGSSFTSKSYSIMDEEWIYNFDPETKKGTKMKNSILSQIAQNANNPDLGEVGLDILTNVGAKKVGTESVAGTSCDVYEITNLGTKTCVWKAVTLKVESQFAGVSVNETATRVSLETPNPELFEIPSDINFSELGDIGNLKNFGR